MSNTILSRSQERMMELDWTFKASGRDYYDIELDIAGGQTVDSLHAAFETVRFDVTRPQTCGMDGNHLVELGRSYQAPVDGENVAIALLHPEEASGLQDQGYTVKPARTAKIA